MLIGENEKYSVVTGLITILFMNSNHHNDTYLHWRCRGLWFCSTEFCEA